MLAVRPLQPPDKSNEPKTPSKMQTPTSWNAAKLFNLLGVTLFHTAVKALPMST